MSPYLDSIVLAFALPLVSALLVTPGVIRLARGAGAVDMPNERKIHTQPVPRLGGLTVYISFFLAAALMIVIHPSIFVSTWFFSAKGTAFLASLVFILLLGIWDDIQPLRPGLKFCVQALIATGCYAAGFRISDVTNPFTSGLFHLGSFDYPLTVLWIVGVTNACNLIDGLDGLASGVGIIASLTIFLITLLGGDIATALLALFLAGSLMGFLKYNFNPARIFLGDSGSLFMGLALAVLSIQSSTKGSTAVAILIPFLALGVPIMDTLISMTRRLLGSFLPGRQESQNLAHKLHSMFLPDRRHIHHQLLALGFSHRGAVLVLYLVSCGFGAGAFLVTILNNAGASFIIFAFAVAMVAGIRHLRYREMAILRNGVLLPLYEWPMINRAIFQSFFDLGFIAVAFTVACALTTGQGPGDDFKQKILTVLPVVCSIQISTFYFLGLYRGIYSHVGVGDLLKIIRPVAVAIIVTSLASMLLMRTYPFFSLPLFIIDFYFLLTLIAGSRLSFNLLNYLFRKESKTGKEILIYGADTNGVLTLHRILNDDGFGLRPAGFLDDNPQLEGKSVNGYEVFGGHWKLPRLLKERHIDQILISSDRIHPEVLKRIKQIAGDYGVVLKRPKVLLEDIALAPLIQSERARAVRSAVLQKKTAGASREAQQSPEEPVLAERNRRM